MGKLIWNNCGSDCVEIKRFVNLNLDNQCSAGEVEKFELENPDNCYCCECTSTDLKLVDCEDDDDCEDGYENEEND